MLQLQFQICIYIIMKYFYWIISIREPEIYFTRLLCKLQLVKLKHIHTLMCVCVYMHLHTHTYKLYLTVKWAKVDHTKSTQNPELGHAPTACMAVLIHLIHLIQRILEQLRLKRDAHTHTHTGWITIYTSTHTHGCMHTFIQPII